MCNRSPEHPVCLPEHPPLTLSFSDLALSIPVWSCVETRHAGTAGHLSPCLVASPPFVVDSDSNENERAVGRVICLLGPDSVLLAVAPSRRSICDVSSPTGKRTGYPRSTLRPSWSLICPPSRQTSYAPAAAASNAASPRNSPGRRQLRLLYPLETTRRGGGVGVAVPQEARGAPKKTPVRWTADDMSPPPFSPRYSCQMAPSSGRWGGGGSRLDPRWAGGVGRDLLVRSQLFEQSLVDDGRCQHPGQRGHDNVSGLKRSVVALSLSPSETSVHAASPPFPHLSPAWAGDESACPPGQHAPTPIIHESADRHLHLGVPTRPWEHGKGGS